MEKETKDDKELLKNKPKLIGEIEEQSGEGQVVHDGEEFSFYA